MCGIIAGYFNCPFLDSHDLHKMTTALAHRGPDGEGFYTDTEALLALVIDA